MESLLEPANYIGRCPAQVEAYMEKLKPLLDEDALKADELTL